jgi:hypothetical protein
MRKNKNLHTSFIKFLLEKYSDDTQRLPDDEEEVPNNKKHLRRLEEDEIEEPIDDEPIDSDDEIIDKLLNEYKRLKKKHENNKIHNRRR